MKQEESLIGTGTKSGWTGCSFYITLSVRRTYSVHVFKAVCFICLCSNKHFILLSHVNR